MAVGKKSPLSLFNKRVPFDRFFPIRECILPAGEFDLSVACNFLPSEISIHLWHPAGYSIRPAAGDIHFLGVSFSFFFLHFHILSFAGRTLINRPSNVWEARGNWDLADKNLSVSA